MALGRFSPRNPTGTDQIKSNNHQLSIQKQQRPIQPLPPQFLNYTLPETNMT